MGDMYKARIRAVKDGVHTTVSGAVVAAAGAGTYYVRGELCRKTAPWYKFWVRADVTPLSMGPYASFVDARTQLEQVMDNHDRALRGGVFFTRDSISYDDDSQATTESP